MKNFDKYRFFNSDKMVVAVSSFAGKPVRGVAKCAPNDEFNLEIGKKLAAARCNAKIALKRYKRTIQKHNAALRAFREAKEAYENLTTLVDTDFAELKESLNDLGELEASMKPKI